MTLRPRAFAKYTHGSAHEGGPRCLQIITRSHAAAFFILCCILLFYTKNNSCATYSMSWVGFAPVQVSNLSPAEQIIGTGIPCICRCTAVPLLIVNPVQWLTSTFKDVSTLPSMAGFILGSQQIRPVAGAQPVQDLTCRQAAKDHPPVKASGRCLQIALTGIIITEALQYMPAAMADHDDRAKPIMQVRSASQTIV